jgi:hypothetical protein
MRNARLSWVAITLVSSVLAVGCGNKETAPTATTAPSATAKPTAKPTATAAAATATATATAEAAPAALVEIDLSPAGAAFKGWVAKGPADAKVMEDLGGARIATPKVAGPGTFDLGFKLGKEDLKKYKADFEKGAKAGGNTKLTFTTDTADMIAWTSEVAGTKTYDFRMIQKSSGKDVTCYTVTPRDNEADLKTVHDACASLEKKDAATAAGTAAATTKPTAAAKGTLKIAAPGK